MYSTSPAMPSRPLLGPVGWVGRSTLATMGYLGGITLFSFGVAGWFLWPRRARNEEVGAHGFMKTMMQQISWMLILGIPLVGMIHIAMGSFLSLQAYYGSTFVDGTGAVVGVGLLRNLGGIMTGLTFSGILAARMIPELRILEQRLSFSGSTPTGSSSTGGRRRAVAPAVASGGRTEIDPHRMAAPRIAAAGIASLLLTQWGITVGTVVGWQASQSMMGLSTATFFMMMLKMMWFRDVVGLIIKGLLFGALPGAICCFEGLVTGARDVEPPDDTSPHQPGDEPAPPWVTPVFRATCLSFVAILILSSSWFMLVYHAVPFYGPTLLPTP
jgi:phospholipid/cholesterol/gamma-HCH transport system permease protein